MKDLHTRLLQRTTLTGKISLLVFTALFNTGKTSAQWDNATPVSKIASPANVRSCGSYRLPTLTSGNYFTAPGGQGEMLNSGDVIASTQTVYIYKSAATRMELPYEKSFVVTIDSIPTINFTLHGSRRTAGQVYLQATPDAGNVYWYTVEAGGETIGKGTGFATPPVSETTTFYAQAVNGMCSSARVAVLALVYPYTMLSPGDCAKTIKSSSDKISCETVRDATAYCFEITGQGNRYVISSKENFLEISSCGNLENGGDYDVRVAAKVKGEWSIYGPSCNIHISESVIVENTALENENLWTGFVPANEPLTVAFPGKVSGMRTTGNQNKKLTAQE